MNEKTILKSSVYVFLIGCVFFLLVGIFLRDISYIIGFILGYIINTIVFLLIIKTADGILKYSTAGFLIGMTFLLKLGLYALGFYLAVKTSYIDIVGVFIGYMVNKVTIYIEGYRHKGGEMSGN